MAATEKESWRRSGYTDGSLALNFDWAVHRQELEHAGEIPRQRAEAPERWRSREYIRDTGQRVPAYTDDFPAPRRRQWESTREEQPEWRTRPAEDPRRDTRRTRRRTTGRREKPRRRNRTAGRSGVLALLRDLYQWGRQIPLLYLAGAVMAGFLAFQMLTGCITLTRLSSETVELKETLLTLQQETAALTTEHEQLFDKTAVEAAAVSAGMVKPSRSQIIYFDSAAGDSAVVYRAVDKGFVGTVAASVLNGFSAVREYFD